MRKNYGYVAPDGNHWPDANLGDAQYYSIDYSEWLVNENDALVDVSWSVPEGLVGTDSHEANSQAFIKLATSERGSFKIVCTIITTENAKQQTKVVPMILKVY